MTHVKCLVHAAARIALACALLGAGPAGALPFSNLIIFGDSLSDAGNNALFFDSQSPPAQPRTPTPIPDNTFFPSLSNGSPFPYASGRYTNDRVWAEYLGAALGAHLKNPVAPSLAGGTDFAAGGATTGPLGFPLPPSLLTQVASFLSATGGTAPGDALYVIAGGGNNALGALNAINLGAPLFPTIAATAAEYASDVAAMVAALSGAGAHDIIVWNTPNVGLTPAVRVDPNPDASLVGTALATAMNAALTAAIGAIDGVEIFDIFGLLNVTPGAFGLTDVENACAALVPCDPSAFLFWDGIHPTSAGHQLIAQAMLLAVIPEPGTLLLLLAVLPVAAASRRRWMTRASGSAES